MASYIEYLIPRIFNNNKKSGRGLSWFQTCSGHIAAGTFRIQLKIHQSQPKIYTLF